MRMRVKSAKLGQRTLQKGFFKQHQDLLVFEEGKKYDFTMKDPQGFTCLRMKDTARGEFNDLDGTGSKSKRSNYTAKK